MAGFFKKIFSFALGKKDQSEPEAQLEQIEQDTTPAEAIVESAPTTPEELPKKAVEKPAKAEPAKKSKPVKKKAKAAPKKAAPEIAVKQKPAIIEKKATQEKKSPEKPPAENKREITQFSATPEPTATSKPSGKVTLNEPKAAIKAASEPAQEDEKTGWFGRLTKGLSRTSNQLTENVTSIFTKRRLDDDTLQELEDVLIQADLGVDTAIRVTEALADQRHGKDVSDEEVREIMAAEIENVLGPVAMPLELDLEHKPHVILMIGVNGSGKTTTIGKLSAKLNKAGLSTLLVAGDTFRAAAIEQLKIWGERTGSPVASRNLGSDAAGLAYDAYQQAKDGGHDVMLMDTAGRLQNKTELMAELEKIIRVLKKQDPKAPHTVLLTLDATTGQNALNQVEVFGKTAGVNGLVMTKLDGTARGGILVSISATHKLPVYFIGVGEQVEDLEPFEAREFARSIAGLNA